MSDINTLEPESTNDLIELIDSHMKPTYKIDTHIYKWVPTNKVRYVNWIDRSFKYPKQKPKCEECNTCTTGVRPDAVSLFPQQKFIKDYMQFSSPYRGVLLYHGLGVGKCHGYDTPICMYNNNKKKMVQDIVVGDQLLGDDYTPRNVLSVTEGEGTIYSVECFFDDKLKHLFTSFTANNEHILCLKDGLSNLSYNEENDCFVVNSIDTEYLKTTNSYFSSEEQAKHFLNESIIQISIKDFLKLPEDIQKRLKAYTNKKTLFAIKISIAYIGSYYGFAVDKNHRYVLGNGIVTHNSCASIAAAEILANHMKVLIMTPASLRNNYINEIKKCGRVFFSNKLSWVFVPAKYVDDTVINKLNVNRDLVKNKQKGLYLPSTSGTPFNDLPDNVQTIITGQVENIIMNSFDFMNHDGLTKKRVEDMIKTKIFDNKCVIIDEIHNFISRISNNSILAKSVYRLLMQAQNIKIILLSGTPIINYPHEIAYLLNIITGPRVLHELKIKNKSEFNLDDVNQFLSKHEYIDQYEINTTSNKIYIHLLPLGFIKTGKYIRREETPKPHETIIKEIKNELSSYEVKCEKKTEEVALVTLPETEDDFNKYFINFEGAKIKNELLFMRRILGTVSYYSSYSPELYPSIDRKDIELFMTDYQFGVYETGRSKERAMEKKKQSKNIFHDGGQVYKFYSRTFCNFVFPEEIKRPFPSKIGHVKNEIDDFDQDVEKTSSKEYRDERKSSSNSEKPTKLLDKKDLKKLYIQALDTALNNLFSSKFLLLENINQYSPKFKSIFENIQKVHGSVLVYSQFRKVEGLGIFGKFLEKNGYVEFKIKPNNNDWDVDIPEEDWDKPKYISFTGSNDVSKVLLNIFNNNFESLPIKLKTKLGTRNNLRGDVIRVLLITKSGSEGISLKNVRQVHLIEPYWNNIRVDQVIGRAVRTCSHVDLPQKDRNVEVFTYRMKFTTEQLSKSYAIKNSDKGLTTDQHIFNMAQHKSMIVNGFLDCMKKASIDCALNAKYYPEGTIKCFGFPVNMNEDNFSSKLRIIDEEDDKSYIRNIIDKKFSGTLYKTKKGNFLVKTDTNEVYDYDLYIESGKLVKLGVLIHEPENKKYTIKYE